MAVQADEPPNSLSGLLNPRHVQLPSIDVSATAEPRSFLLPFSHQNLDAYQQVSNRAWGAPYAAVAVNSSPLHVIPNTATFQQQAGPVALPYHPAYATSQQQRRKRKALSDRQPPTVQPQSLATTNPTTFSLVNSKQAHGSASASPLSGVVSTGLRLAFDDDRSSTVTSSRFDAGSTCLKDEVSVQLLHQQHEVRQLLNTQIKELRHSLEERIYLRSTVLLASIQEEMSRSLQDKEEELGKLRMQYNDLREKLKHMSLETYVWQSKARNFEAMATVLRANLQQALIHQSREQTKLEGWGDSEADDAASAHMDISVDAQQTRAMMMRTRKEVGSNTEFQRACKRCRAGEVTMLLLPCMHLCICSDCSGDVVRCPICSSVISASVKVYLS